ncbi:MAG TPA: hypothetical protein VIP11_09220, partial [Gemmatimonadaceae bacterium]
SRARDVLTRSQGRVAGAAVPILATGRLVREASPTVTLTSWPAPQTQLLTFENAPPELNEVLRASFRITAADSWLFLIGSDGQAREVATRVLRAGASYLLLQKTETRNPAAGLQAVTTSCAGIYGLRIDVPMDVPDGLQVVLSILGLEAAKTLEVWPSGLPVPEWSGDGEAEWVAGQPIVLGVRTDHRLAKLNFAIDGIPQSEIKPAAGESPGAPIFVQLPILEPGQHRIEIAAETAEDPAAPLGTGSRTKRTTGLCGQLSFAIRDPRTSAAGQSGALSFAVLPASPSLEDIWEDRIEVHVAVPGRDSVHARITLRALGGKELFDRKIALPSPCTTEAWRREFAAVRNAAEEKYDDAQVCVLEFDGGALGRGRVTAERDFTPLRWAIRANGHRAVLIDSQGSADLTVSTVPVAAPALEQVVDPALALEGLAIGDSGALVVARSQHFEATTVVVPRQRANSFAALSGDRPQLAIPAREAQALATLASRAAMWERARLAGCSLAGLRRADVVEAIVARIMAAVAGGRWADAEEILGRQGPQAAAGNMRNLIANRADERAVGLVLSERVASCANASVADAERALRESLKPFVDVNDLETLAAFALRFAGSPDQARALVQESIGASGGYQARLNALIDGLLARPVVARAARYLVVATRALIPARDRHALPWGS